MGTPALSSEAIDSQIHIVHGFSVMLDRNLANLSFPSYESGCYGFEITDCDFKAQWRPHSPSKVLRRGRPTLENPKQLLSLRLPPKVIAFWMASGPIGRHA